MRKRIITTAALALALALLLSLIPACAPELAASPVGTQLPAEPGKTAPMPAVELADDAEEDVYALLYERFSARAETAFNSVVDYYVEPTEGPVEMPELAEPEAAAPKSDAAAEHSVTNTQVTGVDEGDIIKTDGEYIYRLVGNELLIYRADGAKSALCYRGAVAEGYTGADGVEKNSWPQELYLAGDRLIVILSRSEWSAEEYREHCCAVFYDVTEPAAPRLVTELGLDGAYNASRLKDGTLYLVTGHSPGLEPVADAPETYVPLVYAGDKAEPVAPDCIGISAREGYSYVVVGALDINSASLTDTAAVLGRGGEVYMSEDAIYVAGRTYESVASEPYTVDNYTVRDCREGSVTHILKFDAQDGGVSVSCEGSVEGSPVNRYALDEKDGHLRIVTTLDSVSYRTFEDEKYGWVNYEGHAWESSTALFILDEGLEPVSEIRGLAPDENVYSVRFDGDIVYFVTFRTVDPLFCADLSDPKNPRLLSELKLPGFSQYMHVYGEGRLFGLGMDADELTGTVGNMKLAMFNTEDKTGITVQHSLVLDSWYSEALYEPRAMLINAARDIIAFPVNGGYEVYGYSDEAGFYRRADIDLSYDWRARGLFIGDCLYVSGETELCVFSLSDFARLAVVGPEL